MTIDGLVRKCVRFKQTRAGRRCAKYRNIRSLEELSGPIRTCQLYVYTKMKGKPVLRCANMIKQRGIPIGIEQYRKFPYHYWRPKKYITYIPAKLQKRKRRR